LVARVPAGDSFTPSQREWLERAVRNAEAFSGLTFSLFVGVSEEDSRAYAERLHRALGVRARILFGHARSGVSQARDSDWPRSASRA